MVLHFRVFSNQMRNRLSRFLFFAVELLSNMWKNTYLNELVIPALYIKCFSIEENNAAALICLKLGPTSYGRIVDFFRVRE